VRIATLEEAMKLDLRSQTDQGLSSEILMESAGSQSAREIEQQYLNEIINGQCLIVCGRGSNGCDGLVVARHLSSQGRHVKVALIGNANKRSETFLVQLRRCKAAMIECFESPSPSEFKLLLAQSSLLVDAVFGLGFHSPMKEPEKAYFQFLHSFKNPIVALDVPSGLEPDSGLADKYCVKADLTLTFGVAKRGFFVNSGPSAVGRLRVLPTGFPKPLIKQICSTHTLVTSQVARMLLPRRDSLANKSNFGHLAVFAGREGMWGAAVLTSTSAYRSGAGYVTLISGERSDEILKVMPEILTGNLKSELTSKRRWKTAAIGPGVGVNSKEIDHALLFLKKNLVPTVVDADAISALSRLKWKSLPKCWILTPHAGELSRLIDVDAKKIEADRFRYARETSDRFGCVVLLKGYRTVIANPDGMTRVVSSGNVGLAKAGTGDVLTGIIAGLLAQGLSCDSASSLGAYLHGRLADEWLKSGRDLAGLQASDLRDAFPQLLFRLRRGLEA
jgi:hydroxyethylthiazole kinase-like uncharacterized protein yjeF